MKNLNVIAIIASVVFLFAGAFFRTTGAGTSEGNPIPEPTIVFNPNSVGKAPIPPGILDFDTCDPNGGLAAKSCKGYRLTGETFTDAKIEEYLERKPKECTYNQNYNPADPATKDPDNFRCIFNFASTACKTYVEVQNEIDGGSRKATVLMMQGNTTGGRKCSFCSTGQTKDGTNFDGVKYCSAGLFIIDKEDPILFGPYFDVPYHCVNVPVNGPYGSISDDFTTCNQSYTHGVAGANFTFQQKTDIKDLNRSHFSAPPNTNRSDLAGFCFTKPPSGYGPAIDNGNKTCTEPGTPIPSSQMQVHHIVPKKSGNSCPCGTNSPRNAAVISAKLNAYFSNKDLTTLTEGCGMQGQSEQEVVNALGNYSVFNALVYFMNRQPKYDFSVVLNRRAEKKAMNPTTIRSKLKAGKAKQKRR